jgi:[lysine-biosynthesis-protein LysW]--L-2-aminoadipate ligase
VGWSGLPGNSRIDRISRAAAKAVGGGAIAIDLLEDPDRGFLVNEVNHTMEYHSTVPLTGVDIPGRIVEFALQEAEKYHEQPVPVLN